MGHKCTYSDKLVFDSDKKQFYRLITAYWKDKSLDIAKVYEDGTSFGRNITFSYLSGYLVDFPGEKVRCVYTRDSHVVEEEPYEQIFWRFNPGVGTSDIDKKYIVQQDPSLKYLIAKFKGDRNDELLKIISMYRNHPEIEPLVELNQCKLALDNRLHKLTKSKKAEVINFVKENIADNQVFDLSKIFSCLKNNIRYKFYQTFNECKDDHILFKYLVKQNQSYYFYQDYKRMAIKVGHNFKEIYWKYPKHLSKAHDKVREECKHFDNAINLVLNKQFEIVAKALKKQEAVINGNQYYIVQETKDFLKHAEALQQCLITSGYMEKFVEQKSILIFIKDQYSNSIGTVEIDYNKNIIQAYGNEADRNNCTLPKEIITDAKKYISKLKLRKHKFTYRMPKNCYYKGLYDGNESFNGMHFEEGKIYSTSYDDQTIIKTDSECLASDKVYHFCDTIQNVKQWISNPSSFAIVEALGPVVKKGTAFGSNKIKIRKITTINDIAKSFLAINKSVSI